MNIHNLISEIQKAGLKGITAHKEMSFIDRNFHKPPDAIPSAVSILLFEKEQQIFFPLIKRTSQSKHHKYQIALPGGKLDECESIELCAIREMEEEIGVDRQYITIIRQLTEVYIPVSNHLVYPFVCYSSVLPVLRYNHNEVEKIILCNIEEFVHLEKQYTKVKLVDNVIIEAPSFIYNNEVIWGATALILNEFKYILKQIY